MVVQKYGGTSVATTEKIAEIAKVLRARLVEEKNIVVVVSAMSGETDFLTQLGKKISSKIVPREMDQLVSLGENKTISLLALALQNLGVRAISLTGWQAGIITTNNFSSAKINKIKIKKIKKLLKTYQIVVVAGFQGVTSGHDITTLGKGGSDTTATALSAFLGCDCEIFTDVEGVFSADPRVCPSAKKIGKISYETLMEMASNGAKVMEPRSVEIAKKYGVKIFIAKSQTNPKEGTIVLNCEDNFEGAMFENITVKSEVCGLEIVFEKLKNFEKLVALFSGLAGNFEMFSLVKKDTNYCANFAIETKNLRALLAQIEGLDISVRQTGNFAKITLTGSGFRTHKDVLQRVLGVLSENAVDVFAMNVDEISISALVREEARPLATQVLVREFNLAESPQISLAIVGATGMVGKTFLKVLAEREIRNQIGHLALFASKESAGQIVEFCGKKLVVQELCKEAVLAEKFDFAFFSAGEDVAKEYAPIFAQRGVIVIDNSSAFRMQKDVPLVVPEINFEMGQKNLIANPNCSTIQAVLPVFALKKAFGVKKIFYSTYQAVSGSGESGVRDLDQTRVGGLPTFYPHPIYNNCLPHIGSFLENGYSSEEIKMIEETKKILGDNALEISATCVRVPVENCHAVAVSVELGENVELDKIVAVISGMEGVKVFDDPQKNIYPINNFANNQDAVLVGRIRKDLFNPHMVHFWCVADNVRKGASTNGVQILEKILKNK